MANSALDLVFISQEVLSFSTRVIRDEPMTMASGGLMPSLQNVLDPIGIDTNGSIEVTLRSIDEYIAKMVSDLQVLARGGSNWSTNATWSQFVNSRLKSGYATLLSQNAFLNAAKYKCATLRKGAPMNGVLQVLSTMLGMYVTQNAITWHSNSYPDIPAAGAYAFAFRPDGIIVYFTADPQRVAQNINFVPSNILTDVVIRNARITIPENDPHHIAHHPDPFTIGGKEYHMGDRINDYDITNTQASAYIAAAHTYSWMIKGDIQNLNPNEAIARPLANTFPYEDALNLYRICKRSPRFHAVMQNIVALWQNFIVNTQNAYHPGPQGQLRAVNAQTLFTKDTFDLIINDGTYAALPNNLMQIWIALNCFLGIMVAYGDINTIEYD